MQTNPARDLRPLLIAVAIGLVIGWLCTRSTPTVDDQLVGLVDKLTTVQVGSTIVASSILAAAAILAAIAIPIVTVLAVMQRSERKDAKPPPESPAPATTALPATPVRPPEAGTAPQLEEPPARQMLARRSNISSSTSDSPKGTS